MLEQCGLDYPVRVNLRSKAERCLLVYYEHMEAKWLNKMSAKYQHIAWRVLNTPL